LHPRCGLITFLLAVGLFLPSGAAQALNGNDILALKAAGVEDATIAELIRHRSIETGQLSVTEVVDLKKAGLSEGTLQQIIARGSFVEGRTDRVYGADGHGVDLLSVGDILRLKAAGIGEETLRVLVAGRGRDRQDAELERAWKMLQDSGVIIDGRD